VRVVFIDISPSPRTGIILLVSLPRNSCSASPPRIMAECKDWIALKQKSECKESQSAFSPPDQQHSMSPLPAAVDIDLSPR